MRNFTNTKNSKTSIILNAAKLKIIHTDSWHQQLHPQIWTKTSISTCRVMRTLQNSYLESSEGFCQQMMHADKLVR